MKLLREFPQTALYFYETNAEHIAFGVFYF